MQGIVGDTVKQLRTVLTDGMARGLGIRDISGMINSRIGVGLSRAKRIARTEINKAYTDAYMAESDELNENLKGDDYSYKTNACIRAWNLKQHRASHAARHGNYYTLSKEQLKWWDSQAAIPN